MEKPTKENTLYLPINQTFFDQIVVGTKKCEYREIKDTTYKKYLDTDEFGGVYWFEEKLDENDPLAGDIMIWNNGVYPYDPIRYQYLSLAVGYNKERDTALVEVTDISFEPMPNREGKPARFHDDGERLMLDDNGELCAWQIVYHLGKVVELHRKDEK